MIRKFTKVLTLTLISSFAFTQNDQNTNWCATDGHNEELYQNMSEKEREKMHQMQKKQQEAYLDYLEGVDIETLAKEDDDIYIIPLVVHVIHDDGVGNISMEQIHDGVRVLNEDLRRKNSDTTQTRDLFKPFAVDAKIEFRLAKIDPDGNCTNGVVRINDSYHSNNGSDQSKSLSRWPPQQYFNYWLVNNIGTSGGGTILGYAQFPWSGINNTYGVVQRNDQWGTIGTAAGSSGRTTVHEVGHCLALFHTFQSGCGGDCSDTGDRICDTPPVNENSWGCPTSENTCSNDTEGPSPFEEDVVDQIENYMSYNSCQNMLTQGQSFYMNWTVEEYLSNLVSPANLDATGVFLPDILCKAQFSVSEDLVCQGEQVNFTDESYTGQTEWEWIFEGATPSTSTAENPTVVYNEPGKYPVTLIVRDGEGEVSTTKDDFITVMEDPFQLPFLEGFEYISTLDEGRWFRERRGGSRSFQLTETASHTGDVSAWIRNYGQPAGVLNKLISSPIDLSKVDGEEGVTFSFRYAYRKRNSDNEEWLRIFYSSDCGNNWALRRNLRGDQLSELTESSEWYPDSADWTTVHLTNITSQFWVENFRMMFEFESDGGNNFFLDDINIYHGEPSDSLLSVSETQNSIFKGIKVYPNPASDDLRVEFSLNTQQRTTITVFNTLGREVKHIPINASPGRNLVHMDISDLNKGMYFLKITSGQSQSELSKVIVH